MALDLPIPTKVCNTCGELLLSSAFTKQRMRCDKCVVETRRKRYYDKHSEMLARRKRYVEENKEKCAAANKEWASRNREQISEYQRAYRKRNKDRINAGIKRWREDNPDKAKSAQRRWYERNKEYLRLAKYGISIDDYDGLLAAQDFKCPICSVDLLAVGGKGPHVDHCHKTGEVRGILCSSCNAMLGMARDNPDILSNGIVYLRKHRAT